MNNLTESKEKSINKIVSILLKMDEPGILLLTRDANTILTYQKVEKEHKNKAS